MGEVLLTTPLMQNLAIKFGKIDVLLCHEQLSLLDGAPFIKKLFSIPSEGLFKPIELFRILSSIPRGHEIIVDAGHRHEPTSSMFITFVLGGRISIGHRRGPYMLYYNRVSNNGGEEMHEIDRKLELLEPLDIEPSTHKMWVPSNNESSLKQKHNIVLYLGSRKQGIRTPIEIGEEIADICRSNNYTIIPMVGRYEKLEDDTLRQGFLYDQKPVRCFAISDMVSAFSSAVAVISNNTGPMHLAVGMDIPTFGLFAGGSIQRWGYNDNPNCSVNIWCDDFKKELKRFLENIQGQR
jgi:ADP-heptose:LPS heptosyltransferase